MSIAYREQPCSLGANHISVRTQLVSLNKEKREGGRGKQLIGRDSSRYPQYVSQTHYHGVNLLNSMTFPISLTNTVPILICFTILHYLSLFMVSIHCMLSKQLDQNTCISHTRRKFVRQTITMRLQRVRDKEDYTNYTHLS
jgi:hypothetical protein